MNLEDCKKHTIAYVPDFTFRDGSTVPKFFIILTNPIKSSNSVIVATFTTKLKYKNKKFTVFISKGSFENSNNKKFPFEDSLLDCNTCCELSLMYLNHSKCKYIIKAEESLISQICKTLPYANRVDSYVMVRLQREI